MILHRLRGLAARIEAYGEPEPNTGCWLWTRQTHRSGGYGRMTVDGKKRPAHRVSYEVFIGPIPDGLFVLHRCDQPACVNPDHLFLGTHEDNMRDMVRKNRHHGYPRLTKQQVIEIRRAHRDGERGASLARRFGVVHGTITLLIQRHTWRTLTE